MTPREQQAQTLIGLVARSDAMAVMTKMTEINSRDIRAALWAGAFALRALDRLEVPPAPVDEAQP